MYIINDVDDASRNELYKYTDIIIMDEINNQLIYIGKSGKNGP